VGAVIAGLLGAGAAAASASFIDTASSGIKLATGTVTDFVGYGRAVDLRGLLHQAATLPGGAPVVVGLGGAVLGGLAGAIVGWFVGAIAHLFKGFRRTIRREVMAELEPGTAAVLTWARDSTAVVARGELERLGGNAPLDEPAAPAAPAADPSVAASGGLGVRSSIPPRT
jgi:hypothetical protein